MKDRLSESFFESIVEIEVILSEMLFRKHSFEEKGFAYFIQFKRKDIVVEFLFGPPDYQIEMIIYTPKGKFAFKDLLEIPTIAAWVKENRYIQRSTRDIKSEMLWFVDLLKLSLKIIEQ